jgi:hypothetical protein
MREHYINSLNILFKVVTQPFVAGYSHFSWVYLFIFVEFLKHVIMKLSIAFILFITTATFFVSCDNDFEEQETLWFNYGTYVDSDQNVLGFILKMDNGDTIIPESLDYIEDGIEDGSRVIPIYTVELQVGQTIYGKVLEIEKIFTKNITQLTEDIQDSIGDDPVQILENNIWLSEKHLNIIFSYYGGGTIHYINLVKPNGAQTDSLGRQILEFKHNANDDIYNYAYSGIVSFDMWSIYQEGMDTLNFVFKSEDYYGEIMEWEGVYVYDTTTTTALQSKIEPAMDFSRFVNDFK